MPLTVKNQKNNLTRTTVIPSLISKKITLNFSEAH